MGEVLQTLGEETKNLCRIKVTIDLPDDPRLVVLNLAEPESMYDPDVVQLVFRDLADAVNKELAKPVEERIVEEGT